MWNEIENFKVKLGVGPEMMRDIFQIEDKPYALWYKFL